MPVRNILFIMVDQLRADCLGGAADIGLGGARLETPHLQELAERGTRFDNAWCQAPICGPSRMSFYTGLYPSTHGSTFNQAPLDAGVMTLGDYLRPLGLKVALCGKTHMRADREGMTRLGLEAREDHGVTVAQAGFDPWLRDDGLHPNREDGSGNPDLAYNRYLWKLGYEGPNPWHDIANSGLGPDGEIQSGWYLRHADKPARVAAEHSETAWLTDRGLEFIDEMGQAPWCLHLSYIKPHWPYIAPSPYHRMYGAENIWPVNRESPNAMGALHPLHRAFMEHAESLSFADPAIRAHVIPAYLGLIREIDDAMGRLMAGLKARGRMDDTLIVFTSDHGDFLGDHALGEKELPFREAAQIPLVVVHPDRPGGLRRTEPVEAIDLVPTFIEAVGGTVPAHRLEGRSLLLLLDHGAVSSTWREAVVAELDYGPRLARRALGLAPNRARLWMLRTADWLYIHHLDLPPQLYDIRNDPDELIDLGRDSGVAATLREMQDRLLEHLIGRPVQRTSPPDAVEHMTDTWDAGGIKIGIW